MKGIPLLRLFIRLDFITINQVVLVDYTIIILGELDLWNLITLGGSLWYRPYWQSL